MRKTIATLGVVFTATSAIGLSFVLPKDLPENQRKRFEKFQSFQIKGVCGDEDLERLAKRGVNTVRGYTIGQPAKVLKKLDEAQSLGMKVILSEWMPHHGENQSRQGSSWTFDYEKNGDRMVNSLMARIEAIGDHPAILMWGLGNEVHLDEPYLRVVNRMSEAIHKRFPHHLTSLTMINAKPEAIAAVKKYAPDLDVLGIQSYSLGAVKGAIRKTEKLWGKPFYMSEFNTKGPWNFDKTEWGVEYDEPVTRKIADLEGCYAAIDASRLCLGSTIFVWGAYSVGDRPTYFSLLFDPYPENKVTKPSFESLLITPQADVMTRHFTRKPIKGNQAPMISKIGFADGDLSKVVKPGEVMHVHFGAEDPDSDSLQYVIHILRTKTKKVTVYDGPVSQGSATEARIEAPQESGEYLLMIHVKDSKGGASASTLPIKVMAGDS
jgi:hypothetical protein